jgi:amino acid transporter
MSIPAPTAPKRQLSVFDSTCIIVGIIVGAAIFRSAPDIAGAMGSATGTMVIWLIGGLLALAMVLSYAELAIAYPREGGDYVYLGRAYGGWAGFLFAWAQMTILRPGDIAMMAFVFSDYAGGLFGEFSHASRIYAAAAVGVFTVINILGVKGGKWTQNVLTVVKAAGLVAILVVGLLAPGASSQPAASQPATSQAAITQPAATQPATSQAAATQRTDDEEGGLTLGGLKLALILVLFTFGGWNEMGYVAAEVRNPRRNILRALVLGTVAVAVLYLLVNAAYLSALGHAKMSASKAVAIDTVATVFPNVAGSAVGALVCISALGAINGLTFAGARITYAMGAEHRPFRRLGTWSGRLGTPVPALLLQGCISIAIILILGGFVETIIYTASVFWLFLLGTAVAVFVLRRREPNVERPYKALGYPITPIIFVGLCLFMVYCTVTFAWQFIPRALIVAEAILLIGAVIYILMLERGLTKQGRLQTGERPPPSDD